MKIVVFDMGGMMVVERDDGTRWVELDGPDGHRQRFPVCMYVHEKKCRFLWCVFNKRLVSDLVLNDAIDEYGTDMTYGSR